ncbi:MAG TPA: twin-arginine translocase TatA/TatE family subunit [Syntrophales bacterium]|nr:twin-arginine translocase TatA/TatE family subunit [Syntrophales bacterium]
MISGGEIIVIFIVVLVLFGPQKLPELARTIGKLMHELNKAMHDVKVQMDTDYEKTENETKDKAGKSSMDQKITEEKSESKDKE